MNDLKAVIAAKVESDNTTSKWMESYAQDFIDVADNDGLEAFLRLELETAYLMEDDILIANGKTLNTDKLVKLVKLMRRKARNVLKSL